MQKTDNYELNLPEAEDFFNIEDFNDNTKKIDEVLESLENPEHDTGKQAEVEELASGESLKVALRKLAKAVADYISHKADKVAHITATERTAWNAKLGVEKIAANLTTDTDGMVLAAAMGKNLKEQIDTNANAISTLNSNKLTGICRTYFYNGAITEGVPVEIATIGSYSNIISISLINCATADKVHDGGTVYMPANGKLMYLPKSTAAATDIRVSVITVK